MSSYGQYCPVARASELLAERWTPIIIRNLLSGCTTFSEIERGAPGISKTLLTSRLRKLERYGVIARRPNPDSRGSAYELTRNGFELGEVIFAMGKWGVRWLEIAPEHVADPGFILWSFSRNIDAERIPKRRLTIRFTFTGRRRFTLWLLVEDGLGEVCIKPPGYDEDVVITADSEWFVRWHLRRCTWSDALAARGIVVEGQRDLIRGFPTWFKPDVFAGIPPVDAEAAHA